MTETKFETEVNLMTMMTAKSMAMLIHLASPVLVTLLLGLTFRLDLSTSVLASEAALTSAAAVFNATSQPFWAKILH